jgi:hypothetical protein
VLAFSITGFGRNRPVDPSQANNAVTYEAISTGAAVFDDQGVPLLVDFDRSIFEFGLQREHPARACLHVSNPSDSDADLSDVVNAIFDKEVFDPVQWAGENPGLRLELQMIGGSHRITYLLSYLRAGTARGVNTKKWEHLHFLVAKPSDQADHYTMGIQSNMTASAFNRVGLGQEIANMITLRRANPNKKAAEVIKLYRQQLLGNGESQVSKYIGM